jgi:cold shock CspA family protein
VTAVRASIVKWFADRRYGFAKPAQAGSHDVYIHADQFIAGIPYVGACIEYEIAPSAGGKRARATNISALVFEELPADSGYPKRRRRG